MATSMHLGNITLPISAKIKHIKLGGNISNPHHRIHVLSKEHEEANDLNHVDVNQLVAGVQIQRQVDHHLGTVYHKEGRGYNLEDVFGDTAICIQIKECLIRIKRAVSAERPWEELGAIEYDQYCVHNKECIL